MIECLIERNAGSGLNGNHFAIVCERRRIRRIAISSNAYVVLGKLIETGQRIGIHIVFRIRCNRDRISVISIRCFLVLDQESLCTGMLPRNLDAILRCRTFYFAEASRFQASRSLLNKHIIHVNVVITAGSCRLTVESKHDRLTCICTHVDVIHFLTGNSDIVIDILRTGVVPFAKNLPGLHAVCRYQHDEAIVQLLALIYLLQCARKLGQSQEERQLVARITNSQFRNRNSRRNQPLVATGSIDVRTCVVVKDTVVRAKDPTGSTGQGCSTISLQLTCSHNPTRRYRRTAERFCVRNTDHGRKTCSLVTAGVVAVTYALYAYLIVGVRHKFCQVIRSQRGVLQHERPIVSTRCFNFHVVESTTACPAKGSGVRSNTQGFQIGRFVTLNGRTTAGGDTQCDDITLTTQRTSYARCCDVILSGIAITVSIDGLFRIC